MRKKTRLITILLIISLFLNGILFFKVKNHLIKTIITFSDANTRDTYDTMHNIKDAHTISKGKGVKIGILGKYFGYELHSDIYCGGKDFIQDDKAFSKIDEHGYWMALTLKEIAPEADIYALNVRSKDKNKEADAIVRAIDWAIENDIDILTYSAEAFTCKNKKKIDCAVDKAIENNIVTTFIHYTHPQNILPFGMIFYKTGIYERQPDINILHYDYNSLRLARYKDYIKEKNSGVHNIEDINPYYSFSSMSPVLAGFVAILKGVKGDLSPKEYRDILIKTSRECEFQGKKIKRVADIYKAVIYLRENY